MNTNLNFFSVKIFNIRKTEFFEINVTLREKKVLHETSQPTTTEYVEKRTFMEAVLKLEALETKLKFLSCKLNDGKEDIDADNTE